jgi:transcriptional regulator with XRE-family HTH domain
MANSMLAAPVKRGRHRAQVIDHHIAARLRQRRIMLGLTQQQVAEMVGITYQQAHKYETGANRISVGRLHALARALEVDVGYFYEGLGSGGPARPTARQRQMLDLARSFAALPRRQQEALCELARALAGGEVEAGPAPEGDGDGEAA